ncbi:NAD(P)/FAD-dependent oxidoreductase [Paenibacillus cremeus]|uniref:NAD(P)/FAD-dependent oxidoreductase n=1 Tax=Paenibacillus cremeus TaxID=2163881 RepID=A0A559KAP4_9BACL|nr:NAD(P)/FAD-dependent oxidoreductase [Paenibacillus cremeus]TVY09194.1 NAD(P)/FAD-dependent oxidoreductase [Paenibacillus cremeus]
MSRILDAAVLGAGIAGSSLAKALADRGWETVVLDRQRFPRHKVCGEFLSPESQQMLTAFGLRDAVQSLQPSSITKIRLILGRGDPLEIPLPGMALGVSRHALDLALHREAASSGAEVQTAATVTAVYPDAEGYTIETKRETGIHTLKARTVIAAWGANRRSGLPGQAPKRESAAKRKTYMGVKSHFSGIEMEPVVELYFFPGGYLGICPVEGGSINAAALVSPKAFGIHEKTILGLIEAAGRSNPRLEQRLAGAVPIPGTQAAVAPVDLARNPVAWDMIPHVGDAAMMLPPLCGDGMSLALRSALRCASFADRYLQGSISLSQWEYEYSQSLVREFQGPLRWGRLLSWLLSSSTLSSPLLSLAQFTPRLTSSLVRATRLKELE